MLAASCLLCCFMHYTVLKPEHWNVHLINLTSSRVFFCTFRVQWGMICCCFVVLSDEMMEADNSVFWYLHVAKLLFGSLAVFSMYVKLHPSFSNECVFIQLKKHITLIIAGFTFAWWLPSPTQDCRLVKTFKESSTITVFLEPVLPNVSDLTRCDH